MRRMRLVAAPFDAQYANRFHKSFARGSGAESRQQQVARFRGRRRRRRGLEPVQLALLVVALLAGAMGAAAHANKAPAPPEVGEPEEEVSLLVAPQKTARARPRESPIIKLELKFPSNGQPVGPPRVSHHPAPARQKDSARASKGAGEQVARQQQQQQQQHFDSQIATNKSEAQLDCDSGQMVLRLNFSEPFRGVVYPDHNRLSPCRFFGDGHLNYELRIPLQGCGSRQTSQRVFINNVVVRFHRTLELEEDEVKTLICRYPAPADQAEQLASSAPGSALSNGSQTQSQTHIEQESQFELLDPSSIGDLAASKGGQARPGLAIETLSDNLVVGPGLHQHHLLQTGRPYSTPNRSGELVAAEQPSWWQNQSAIPARTEDKLLSHRHNNNSLLAFLDRMSSVELLFLTSSLMFLLLLLVALSIGYCCYKRQAARESNRLTSAILNRSRGGFGSPQTAALSGIRCGPLNSGHRQRLLGSYTAGPSAARWVVPQQQRHPHIPGHQHLAPASSSSPESDQSAHRGLLGQVKPGAHYNAAFVGSQSHLHPRKATSRQDKRHSRGNLEGGRRKSTPHSALGLRSAALYGLPACQLAVPTMAHHHKRPSHHREMQPDNQMERTKSMLNMQPFDDASEIYALGKPSLNMNSSKHINSNTNTNYKRRQRKGAHLQQVAGTSESDPEDADRMHSTSCRATPHTAASSKLVLKSIEDSFITNLTEIHSQEYKKRNSMQPLHINKWRSLKRELLTPTASANLATDPPTGLASSTDADSGQEQYQLHNNLRSLTEMDVVFSQPSDNSQTNNLFTTTTDPLAPQTPTPAAVNNCANTQTSSNREEPQSSNNNPPLAEQIIAGQGAAPKPAVSSQFGVSQLADLILSPEYEHSDTSKLELKSPSSPHNSVSYV